MVIASRRQWLQRASNGFGAIALTAMLQKAGLASSRGNHPLHHPAKAKSIIFLYMDGGPSQVDTFDPKPLLTQHHGKNPADFFQVAPTQFNNNGTVLGSPWTFQKHGESGIEVSSLFPHVAKHVDKLALVRSMTSQFPEHTFANYFLHTGSGLQGRPAWVPG